MRVPRWHRRNDTLGDALAICLDALAAGESVGACLQRFPRYAAALAPLLATAQQGRALAATAPSEDARIIARAAVLRRAAERRMPVPVAPHPAVRRRGWLALAPAALAAAMFAAIAVPVVGALDAGTTPGDWNYGLKRATERVQLALATDPADRRLLRLEFASRRLDEIERLSQNGHIDGHASAVASLITDYKTDVSQVGSQVAAQPAIDPATKQHVDDLSTKAQTVLQPVAASTTASVAPAAAAALHTTDQAVQIADTAPVSSPSKPNQPAVARATPSPTEAPAATAASPSATPAPQRTPAPTPSPSPAPSATPSPAPSVRPSPTSTPPPTASVTPAATSTAAPPPLRPDQVLLPAVTPSAAATVDATPATPAAPTVTPPAATATASPTGTPVTAAATPGASSTPTAFGAAGTPVPATASPDRTPAPAASSAPSVPTPVATRAAAIVSHTPQPVALHAGDNPIVYGGEPLPLTTLLGPALRYVVYVSYTDAAGYTHLWYPGNVPPLIGRANGVFTIRIRPGANVTLPLP